MVTVTRAAPCAGSAVVVSVASSVASLSLSLPQPASAVAANATIAAIAHRFVLYTSTSEVDRPAAVCVSGWTLSPDLPARGGDGDPAAPRRAEGGGAKYGA